MEIYERDWKDSLLREVREETGLVCQNPVPIGVDLEEDPYQIKYCVYFTIKCSTFDSFKIDPEEHSDHKWVGYRDASRLNIDPKPLKKIVLDYLRK